MIADQLAKHEMSGGSTPLCNLLIFRVDLSMVEYGNCCIKFNYKSPKSTNVRFDLEEMRYEQTVVS